jgi:hypothetical protein
MSSESHDENENVSLTQSGLHSAEEHATCYIPSLMQDDLFQLLCSDRVLLKAMQPSLSPSLSLSTSTPLSQYRSLAKLSVLSVYPSIMGNICCSIAGVRIMVAREFLSVRWRWMEVSKPCIFYITCNLLRSRWYNDAVITSTMDMES